MQQKTLEFIVDDQFIRAPHYTVVADSKDYLVAHFTFSEAWQGLVKTAVFQAADGKAYFVVLDKDTCPIPAEVIQPTRFLVSVFGGDRLTADRVMVEVAASGFTASGITPPTPTPDVYNQLMEAIAEDRQLAEAAAVTAAEKAEDCVYLTTAAETLFHEAEAVPSLVEAAKKAEQQAKNHVLSAKEHAADAQAAATGAERHQETACVHATSASTFSIAAEEMARAAETSANHAQRAAEDAELASQIAVDAAATVPKDWQLFETVVITEPTTSLAYTFPNQPVKEVYFEGTVYTHDKTSASQNFTIGTSSGSTLWIGSGSFGNQTYPKMLVRGHIFLSPSGTLVCNASISLYGYTMDSSGKSFTTTGRFNEATFTNRVGVSGLFLKVAGGFADGTTFKIWCK